MGLDRVVTGEGGELEVTIGGEEETKFERELRRAWGGVEGEEETEVGGEIGMGIVE